METSEIAAEGANELEAQTGVLNMEEIANTWSKWGLIIAYGRFVSNSCETKTKANRQVQSVLDLFYYLA